MALNRQESYRSYLSPVLPVPDIVIATDDTGPVEGVDHDADDEQHYEIGQAATRGCSLVVVGIVTSEPRAAAATAVVIVASPLISKQIDFHHQDIHERHYGEII